MTFGLNEKRGAWVGRCAAGLLVFGCLRASGQVGAQASYIAPKPSAALVRGVDFAKAQVLDPQLTNVYQACDRSSERGGCSSDPAHNTVILRFADGTVFFDAKMAVDADGSTLSKRAERPNQPETSFRYPNAPGPAGGPGTPDPMATGPGPSLDAERVPYVVMPLGDFRRESGVSIGDLAAVIKDGNLQFAIVGDLGPRTHIGEGSMKMHEQLGHTICTTYDEGHNCSAFTDYSIDAPVLYFFFPDTRKLIIDGLNAGNINERIAKAGQKVWSDFLARQRVGATASGDRASRTATAQ
jgi:hypothetical protein